MNKLNSVLFKFWGMFNPNYRILNKEFFNLNKRINSLEYQLAHTRNILHSMSMSNKDSFMRVHHFQTDFGPLYFQYSIFNEHDFKEIIKEILLPNYFKIDKDATYYFKDLQFNENDVVVDIGSNIGLFSIPLAKAFPLIKIVCFEPLSQNADILERNISLNNIQNIIVVRKGVSDKNKKVLFQWNPFHNGNAGSTNQRFSESQHEVIYSIENKLEFEEVELCSFDEEMDRLGIVKIKLLKMDCEGGEYDIVFGNKKFNSKFIDEIRGEVHLLGSENYKDEYCKLSRFLKTEFHEKCRMDCMNEYDKQFQI
jgi:FkbM family methyltransferase